MTEATSFEGQADQFRECFGRIRSEIAKVVVGQEQVVEELLTGLFGGGHVLLEGVPGIGKTLLVNTIARAIDCNFARIQFTPDLMPSDIIGTRVVVEDEEGRKQFVFQRGPIFTQVLLADEVNRATPKTQSALLEAMQEHSVTIAGETHRLKEPFFVIATQNPLEMEGTYPLPEAQVDRFFYKLNVHFPSRDDLIEVVHRTTTRAHPQAAHAAHADDIVALIATVRDVPIAGHVEQYAADVLLATHPGNPLAPEGVNRYVKYGASPRGLQAMILGAKVRALLDNRYNVAEEDIQAVAPPALRHRLLLNFEGEAEGIDPDTIVSEILEAAHAPAG